MSYSDERQHIETRISAALAGYVVEYNNAPQQVDKTGLWCRVTINHAPSETAGLGQGVRTRVNGLILVQVFDQKDAGTVASLAVVDILVANLRHAIFNGITCRNVTVTQGGEVNGVHQINLSIPFYRYEV
jgi:hypothetical protein